MRPWHRRSFPGRGASAAVTGSRNICTERCEDHLTVFNRQNPDRENIDDADQWALLCLATDECAPSAHTQDQMLCPDRGSDTSVLHPRGKLRSPGRRSTRSLDSLYHLKNSSDLWRTVDLTIHQRCSPSVRPDFATTENSEMPMNPAG